ncbi:uncharacterized protein LOC130990751 [Salvia miltiorrhiza]|uniref:uncharacterized protein LOC130990751 n=1 Tax=Salvia miltiorrhiza TaxID=226208 RepID=UPI0025AC062A|nr:uncharacterized protein LOC130990751 [Salvia miltiorrhiza]
MAKTKGETGSGSTQVPAKKKAAKPRPLTKRTIRQTASEETSIKATEEPVVVSQAEEIGPEDVPVMEEREVEKETSEEMVEKSEKAMAEEQVAPTPPVKKPRKALKKATPAQTAKERESSPILPAPQAPSLEEGKTATASEEGEEATQEIEVEASTRQSKVARVGVKRKLDVTKPPLPTKTRPAAARSKTKGKEVQSRIRRATPAEKGKGKQAEEDPERTETVDSSRSEEVLAPKKPTSSTATTTKPKLAKQKGLIRTTASGAEKVEGYFEGIGWRKVLEWNPRAFQKLTEEFMGTVEFKTKGNYTIETPGTLRFQMQGRVFPLSINELNIHLGVIETTEVYEEEYKQAETIATPEWRSRIDHYWSLLSTGRKYVKNISKSNEIQDPALQICHRWLAYNIYGRLEGSNVVTQ